MKWRQFDHKGNFLFNGSTDPVIDVKHPKDATSDDVILVDADHQIEIKPGYGTIKAFYHLGLKPNILKNGDFRLKIAVDPNNANGYSLKIDKEGWTLVNGGYAVEETYEQLTEGNVAYKLIGRGSISGMAYLQSDVYPMAMGANNQFKLDIRCKVTSPAFKYVAITYRPDVPYIKIRLRVRYGNLYLKSDGTWDTSENFVVFFAKEFGRYLDFTLTANAPDELETPLSGNDFEVRVYHAYTYHAQFGALADLKAYATVDIANGYQTELKTSEFSGSYVGMYFYKLNETTEADDDFNIVRPDDYHASTNPRQWVRDASFNAQFQETAPGDIQAVHAFNIDYVKVAFLTDGQAPIDTIVRSIKGETQNRHTLEKHVYIGSYSNLVVTEFQQWGLNLGPFFGPMAPSPPVTQNILSAELLYTGWLRDANGNGYELWARSGVSEADQLHGILLKQYVAQYKRSWRLLRGSVYTKRYFGLLNVLRFPNDSNRIYLPIALTLNDRRATISGEFLELTNINEEPATPFTSGFTSGFGRAGFQ